MKSRALLYGTVVRGERIGRTIGYPTANLDHRYFKTNPQPKGVYAARAWVGTRYFPALAVIGVPGLRFPQGKVEVHLLDYSGVLYGRTVHAVLVRRLRPLAWYRDSADLKRRIAADIRAAKPIVRRAEDDDALKRQAIRLGTRIAAQRFSHVRKLLRIGASELDVAEGIRRVFRDFSLSFPTIVASGPFGASMHHVPTKRKLRPGDAVVVDFGIRVNGFCTDLSRTLFMGAPDARQKRRYRAVLAAHDLGIRAVKPFVASRAVDAVVRMSLKRARLGHAFIHGTGHGVGAKIHEPPRIGPKSVDIILPGDIVTVEPGVYLQQWGGIRIEDMVEVGAAGSKALTAMIPTSLRSAVVC